MQGRYQLIGICFGKLSEKGLKSWREKMKPETADTGYQIIGICRNSRLDYFPVFAGYLYRITIQGNFILAEKSKFLLISKHEKSFNSVRFKSMQFAKRNA